MRLSITWPAEVRSENDARVLSRAAMFGVVARARTQRRLMPQLLGKYFTPPPLYLPGDPPPANRFVVTLTRISPGYLDDDNLRGAFKNLRDGIADWMGLDDGDARLSWQYAQQGCPMKQRGATVEIVDLRPGEDERVILDGVPERLAAPVPRVPRDAARPKLPDAQAPQQQLTFRRSWAQLPWDPAGVVTELQLGIDAPEAIRMRVPTRALSDGFRLPPGAIVLLRRRAERDAGLGGDVWLYEEVR